jgi:hypothetical protein
MYNRFYGEAIGNSEAVLALERKTLEYQHHQYQLCVTILSPLQH